MKTLKLKFKTWFSLIVITFLCVGNCTAGEPAYLILGKSGGWKEKEIAKEFYKSHIWLITTSNNLRNLFNTYDLKEKFKSLPILKNNKDFKKWMQTHFRWKLDKRKKVARVWLNAGNPAEQALILNQLVSAHIKFRKKTLQKRWEVGLDNHEHSYEYAKKVIEERELKIKLARGEGKPPDPEHYITIEKFQAEYWKFRNAYDTLKKQKPKFQLIIIRPASNQS